MNENKVNNIIDIIINSDINQDGSALSGTSKQNQKQRSLEYIIELLTHGFLRQMDDEMNINNNQYIQFPQLIYNETFNFFPRYLDMHLGLLPPNNDKVTTLSFNLNLYVAGCYLCVDDELNIDLIYECTQRIRKLLSIERNPPIDEIIFTGITPKFVAFLTDKYDKFANLQFEATWALTNICSGSHQHVDHVINNPNNPQNVIKLFIQLLQSENIQLKEQSIWALGNICGDSPQYRDLVLSNDILTNLVPMIQSMTTEAAIDPQSFSNAKKTCLRYVINRVYLQDLT